MPTPPPNALTPVTTGLSLPASDIPAWVEWRALVPGERIPALYLPQRLILLVARYRHTSYESKVPLNMVGGSGTMWRGHSSERFYSMVVQAHTAPVVMRQCFTTLLNKATAEAARDHAKLNYQVLLKTLDLDGWTGPGHWLHEAVYG